MKAVTSNSQMPNFSTPKMVSPLKLNLGCGNKKKPGFIGVDQYECDALDIKADLNKRLPFEDSTVREILMDNVIEHIAEIPKLMGEIHRICANGASITIITPHFSSDSSWRDPTHIHHLSIYSMIHFCKKSVSHYTGGGFVEDQTKLSFSGGIMGLIARLLYKTNPQKYEAKWCFIFRASTITYSLKVEK
jgi:SAM-dependent methyltransferase